MIHNSDLTGENAAESSSDLYLYLIILILSVICIFYTLVGGMKAVLWADTINGVALIGTMITIAGRLLYKISFSDVIETCTNSNCQSMGSSWLTVSEHFDITYRNPPFFYAIRMFVDCIITLPLQQAMVQRFNMCNTMTKGRQAMGFATFLIVTTISISVFIGMATLAYYYGNRSDLYYTYVFMFSVLLLYYFPVVYTI